MKSYTELRPDIESGALSCADLVDEAIQAMRQRVDINAVLEAFEDDARVQAEALDESGCCSGKRPLQGMTIAVKDNICVKDHVVSCGSLMLDGFRARYDATAVRRLRDAGAVMVCRTNMDEFAMGSSTEFSAFGTTRNPWDTGRVPGGSSGGSAVAVATGMALAALGSDTGGSIRQPAAFTGVVGVKPGYGRISRYGLVSFASSLDTVGYFCRCVEDAVLLFDVLTGPDGKDATCRSDAVSRQDMADHDISGLTIGVPQEFYRSSLHEDVRKAIDGTINALREAGVVIETVSLPTLEYCLPTYHILANAEASSNLARYDGVRFGRGMKSDEGYHEDVTAARSENFGPEVMRRILLGTFVLSAGYHRAFYEKAQRVRTLIAKDFARVFKSCDVLLAPVTEGPAFKLGERLGKPLAMYDADRFTVPANLAGIPAMSIPAGTGVGSLPVGVQLMADEGNEYTMFRCAQFVENAWKR